MPTLTSRLPARWRHLLPAAALLLLGACLDRGPSLVSPAQAAAASEGTSEHRLRLAGSERSYRLFVPASLDRTKPAPLILALHGGYGTGKFMQGMAGLDAPAGAAGFMVAYPDGESLSWNAGSCCGPAMKQQIDDVGFIKALVEDIGQRQPLDRQRIYGTGFSNGAMMIHRVACELPELFAAIAPVAGGRMVPACKPARAVSALLVQGRADPRIPWEGGVFEGNPRPSMREVAASLGVRNGCGTAEKISRQQGIVTCNTLPGCAAGAEVTWCGLEGVGHQWPGGRELFPRLLGKNTTAFNASQEAVRFFQKH